MTNKEKREYICCFHLSDQLNCCTIEQIERIKEVLNKRPKSLFKYRSFDKYSFDMIENNYVYLSPVKDLDDPYDCISDFDTTSIVDKNKGIISDSQLEHLINETHLQLNSEHLNIIKTHKGVINSDSSLNEEELKLALVKMGIKDDSDKKNTISLFQQFTRITQSIENSIPLEEFGKTMMNPGDKYGVCSLSEIHYNKPMWSLYGNEYKGYCVEYEIVPNKPRCYLMPVIYSRNPNNNFAKKLIDTIYSETNRQLSMLNRYFQDGEIFNVGAIYELFCSKDIDWSYQKEWRLVGQAKDHYEKVKIKAVYLGFKVLKRNEERMVSHAKRYGFNVYKMKAPDGKKKIRFTKIV